MTHQVKGLFGPGGVSGRFVDQGLVNAGNILVSIIAARVLGPSNFGLFVLLWTINAFALAAQWALIAAPMQTTVPRATHADRPELRAALLSQSIIVAVCGSLAAVLVWTLSSAQPLRLGDLAWVAVSFGPPIVQDFVRRWLLVTDRPMQALLSDGVRYAGSIAGVSWLWWCGGDIEGVLAVIGAAALAGCVACRSGEGLRFSWSACARYAKLHGFVLLPFVAVQASIAAAPVYALSAFMSRASAGGYRACLSLVAPMIVLTEALETFLPLRAAELAERPGERRKLLLRWQTAILSVSIAYAAILALFGAWLIERAFGADYAHFAVLLPPLSIAGVLQNLAYIRNVELRATARVRQVLRAELITAASLLAAYVLIPFGADGEGVAFAAIVAQVTRLIALYGDPLVNGLTRGRSEK